MLKIFKIVASIMDPEGTFWNETRYFNSLVKVISAHPPCVPNNNEFYTWRIFKLSTEQSFF
jgi:hypothetical protein